MIPCSTNAAFNSPIFVVRSLIATTSAAESRSRPAVSFARGALAAMYCAAKGGYMVSAERKDCLSEPTTHLLHLGTAGHQEQVEAGKEFTLPTTEFGDFWADGLD